MSMTSTTSGIVSFALSLMLFSSMQFFKIQLGCSLGSILFMLLFIGFNNFENVLLDDYFQAKIFPEVFICLGAALFSCAMVHRVSVTTCLIFSLVHIFYINKISNEIYQSPVDVVVTKSKSKKKKH